MSVGVDFLDVGWDTARKAAPVGAIQVPTLADFETELAKYLPGGPLEGQSVDFHFTGLQYDEIGVEDYENSDGGFGLGLYARQDGATQVRYTGGGMAEAASAVFRIGSAPNSFGDSSKIRVCNFDLIGNGVGGATWGVGIGATYGNDPRRSNVSDIVFEANRVRNIEQTGIAVDGNGGSTRVSILNNTVQETGQEYTPGTQFGFGEGIYLGSGQFGRAYSNFLVMGNDVRNIVMGEGIEAKRNGTNVTIAYNLVRDVLLSDGAGIKTTATSAVVRGNRVYNVTANSDSFTSTGNAFQVNRSTLLENNVGFGCSGACVSVPSVTAGQTIISRHNTFDATGGTQVWKLDQDGTSRGTNPQTVIAENDITVGTLWTGNLNGSTFAGFAGALSDFVGPFGGSADAGAGPASGYCLNPASGAVDSAPVAGTSIDISLNARPQNGTADFGAFEISTVIDPLPDAQPDNFTGVVGDAVNVNVATNDSGGDPPSTWTILSGTLPPGLMWANGLVSGTYTGAGTFQVVYQITDSNGAQSTSTVDFVVTEGTTPPVNTDDCKQIVLYFVTLPEGVTSVADCPELPCIVDENGDPYDVGFDVDGNSCLIIPNPNPSKDPALYDSDAGESPPALCCVTNFDIGTPAYDTFGECVTHICMGENLGWQPLCGATDPVDPVDPPDPDDTMDRVCYDLSGHLPAGYGGGGATWLVSTIDQLSNIGCAPGSGVASPSDISRSNDQCSTAGSPPAPGSIPGFTFVSTGQSSIVDGTLGTYLPPCIRPDYLVEFGSPVGTGPAVISFDITDADGNIGFWAYNTCTDQLEDIASVTAPPGSVHSINSSAYGDWLFVGSASGITGAYTMALADAGVDVSCVQLIVAAVNDPRGGGAQNGPEIIENIEITFSPLGAGDCCFSAATAADVAALLTAEDPIGNVWTATGNEVCSDMPLGQGAVYGELDLCDGSAGTPTVTTF